MIKRRREQQTESHERWLVSYADFITLLLAFFVVLFATSQRDSDKSKKFEESVKKYLMHLNAGLGGVSPPGQGSQQEAPISQPLKKFQGPQKGAEVQLKIERFVESELSEREIDRLFLDIGGTAVGVRISFKAETLFEPGSSRIKRAGAQVLDKFLPVLRRSKDRIFVEGHTGANTPLPSTFSDQWSFAGARAESLLRYMIEEHGFSRSRMATISYGNQKLIFTQESDQLNERVDLLVATDDLPL